MEEVRIEITKRKLKLKARNISEAIRKLSQLENEKSSNAKIIVKEYFGIFKTSNYDYRTNEENWYKQ
jgi:hypothetical protein